MFDLYHKWLGIPKDQRPPTLYELLGISPSERDDEVIDEAAIRQTAHIRTYQIGAHAQECTRILAEIAQARITLLNPAKRKEYDAQLASKQVAADATEIMAAPPRPRGGVAPARFLDDESDHADTRERPKKKKRRSKSSADDQPTLSQPMLFGIIGGGVALLLVIVLVVALTRRGGAAPGNRDLAQGAEKRPKTPVVATVDAGDPIDETDAPAKPKDQPRAVPPAPSSNAPTSPAKRSSDGKAFFPPGTLAKHFVDPDGDSTLSANDKDGVFRLRVPAFHDLYPNRAVNAPRVMLDVEGDFLAELRVEGSMIAAPGLEVPNIQMSYRCGCLIVWQDELNFMRFDRGGKTTSKGQQSSYMNFQLFEDGKQRAFIQPPCLDDSATLHVERRGKDLVASWEQNGTHKVLTQRLVRWPANVKVGAGALNVSTQAFQIDFAGFKVTAAP